jgi:hygromycin-B 4-O-kinase
MSGDLSPRRARALATRVVQDAFGEKPRGMRPLGGGLTNAVFRGRACGGSWVVRLNADPQKASDFAKEHWAMEHARRAGVPTPRVALVAHGPDDVAYMIVEAKEGQAATRVGHRQPLIAEMGRCAARLHRVPTEGFGAGFDAAGERWAGHPRWSQCLDEELHARDRFAVLRRQGALPRAALDELGETLDEMRRWRRRPVLHHGDLRLKNVIADAEGERLEAIVDWENCLCAPGPYWDLSIALHDLGVDEKEVFLDGYGMSARAFADAARFVRALNLLNYAWAFGEAQRERDARHLGWLRLRLQGGFDITAAG